MDDAEVREQELHDRRMAAREARRAQLIGIDELLNAEIDRDEARHALHDARHEIERLRAALAEIVRMYDDDDECGDLDAADLAEIARIVIATSETKSPARHEASGAS